MVVEDCCYNGFIEISHIDIERWFYWWYGTRLGGNTESRMFVEG